MEESKPASRRTSLRAGLSRREREQAGREPEASAVDLQSLQRRKRVFVESWLTSQRLGSIIRSCRAAGKSRSICGGITGKLRDINGSLFSRQTVFWGESKNRPFTVTNTNSGGDDSGIWTGTPPMITGKHTQGVLSDAGRLGRGTR